MYRIIVTVNNERVISDTVYEYEEAEVLREEYQNIYGNNCEVVIEEC